MGCDCVLYTFFSSLERDEYCENVHCLYWIKFAKLTAGIFL